jgi:hypothetical protein
MTPHTMLPATIATVATEPLKAIGGAGFHRAVAVATPGDSCDSHTRPGDRGKPFRSTHAAPTVASCRNGIAVKSAPTEPPEAIGGAGLPATVAIVATVAVANIKNSKTLFATCHTPEGNPLRVPARDERHAAWLTRMNPPPPPKPCTGPVRCADCRNHTVLAWHPALTGCRVGVQAPGAIRFWWKTDQHLCDRYAAIRGEGGHDRP